MPVRALVVAVLLLTAMGCGSLPSPPVLVGTAGVTVDERGDAVIVLARCDDRRVEVSVHAAVDHNADPDRENPLLAQWVQVSAGPVNRLALAEPGPAWRPSTALDVRAGELVVSVSVAGSDSDILTGFTFTRAQLDELGPGQVLTDTGIVDAGDLAPVCE
jgi:hypothetical protein